MRWIQFASGVRSSSVSVKKWIAAGAALLASDGVVAAPVPIAPSAVEVAITLSPKAAASAAKRPSALKMSLGYYGAPITPSIRQRDPTNVADDGSRAILLGGEPEQNVPARAGRLKIAVRGLDRARLSWVKRLWIGVSAYSDPNVGGPMQILCDGNSTPMEGPGQQPLKIDCYIASERPEAEDMPQGSAPELKY